MEAQGDQKKLEYIVPTKQVKCIDDVKKWENFNYVELVYLDNSLEKR